jgi:hypothetical protein
MRNKIKKMSQNFWYTRYVVSYSLISIGEKMIYCMENDYQIQIRINLLESIKSETQIQIRVWKMVNKWNRDSNSKCLISTSCSRDIDFI